MKIAYLSNSRFPSNRAHSTQIVQNCNALASLGHEVNLFVTDRKTNISDAPEQYYGAKFLFSTHRISVPDMAAWGDSLPSFLKVPALTVQRLVFTHKAVRSIETKNADVIYSRDEWVLWFLSFFLGYEKLVYESHEAKYSKAVRSLARHGVPFVVISEGIKAAYSERGIPDSQILVAHDGIDESFIDAPGTKAEARDRLGIKTEKPVVMYFGGLEKWKGVDTLCLAAEGTDNFEVFVCGGSPAQVKLYKATYPWVTFLGFTAYRDLPQLQKAADVLVIPNTATSDLSSKYTSPLKVFTYMASGVPVVASDIPSIRSVLDESTATFAEPDNPESFKSAIVQCLQGSTQSQLKADQAQVVVTKYTWKNRAQSICNFLTI